MSIPNTWKYSDESHQLILDWYERLRSYSQTCAAIFQQFQIAIEKAIDKLNSITSKWQQDIIDFLPYFISTFSTKIYK